MDKKRGRPRHPIERNDRYKSILVDINMKEDLDKYKNKLNAKTYPELFRKFMQLAEERVNLPVS